jgi:hypothetical protein
VSRGANLLVKCMKCNVFVHQRCYARDLLDFHVTMHVRHGLWQCERCSDPEPQKITCAICPFKQGIIIKSSAWETEKNLWVHKTCVDFHPTIRFSKHYSIRGEPKSLIIDTMNKQSCDICMNNLGITLKCGFTDCLKFLHIRCALNAGNIE